MRTSSCSVGEAAPCCARLRGPLLFPVDVVLAVKEALFVVVEQVILGPFVRIAAEKVVGRQHYSNTTTRLQPRHVREAVPTARMPDLIQRKTQVRHPSSGRLRILADGDFAVRLAASLHHQLLVRDREVAPLQD